MDERAAAVAHVGMGVRLACGAVMLAVSVAWWRYGCDVIAKSGLRAERDAGT